MDWTKGTFDEDMVRWYLIGYEKIWSILGGYTVVGETKKESEVFFVSNVWRNCLLHYCILTVVSFIICCFTSHDVFFKCWLALRRWVTSCSMSLTLQHESSRTHASSTGDLLISDEQSYTGCMLSTGFGSEFAFNSCVQMSAQHGSWIPVHSLPTRLRHSCHLRSADRSHLVFPHIRLATYSRRAFAYAGQSDFLPISETIVFLSQLSNAFLRSFSSLSISTRSTFRVLIQKLAIYIHCYYLLLLLGRLPKVDLII